MVRVEAHYQLCRIAEVVIHSEQARVFVHRVLAGSEPGKRIRIFRWSISFWPGIQDRRELGMGTADLGSVSVRWDESTDGLCERLAQGFPIDKEEQLVF